MATKQVRNIINSQLDFLLNRAEKEIRNESQKQLEKLKARIPSPQSIIDDMTVDVNNDTCSIKGSEKYDKMYNLLDNKLSNIEELLNKSLNRIDKLKEKIRKFRKAGLDRAGEFSSENIAFKALRRNNYLENLSNLKHMAYDKLMSKTSDGLITVKINETVQSWKEFIKG